jgi:hypothetical protein
VVPQQRPVIGSCIMEGAAAAARRVFATLTNYTEEYVMAYSDRHWTYTVAVTASWAQMAVAASNKHRWAARMLRVIIKLKHVAHADGLISSKISTLHLPSSGVLHDSKHVC